MMSFLFLSPRVLSGIPIPEPPLYTVTVVCVFTLKNRLAGTVPFAVHNHLLTYVREQPHNLVP